MAFTVLNVPVDLHLLKKPIVGAASSQLGLHVTIDGNLQLVPGLEPTLEMRGLAITDPELGMDQLEQVQRDVSRLLEHGLTDPAVTPPPDGGTPDPAPAPLASGETDPRNSD